MDISFLKKKELGMPIWAWGLIVAVLMFILYRHYKNAGAVSSPSLGTSTTPDSTPVGGDLSSDPSGGGGLGGGTGDAGGSSDTSSGLAALASVLEPQGEYYQTLLDGLQGATDPTDATPPDIGHSNPLAAQTAGINPLNWGNITFKSRTAFDSYLKKNGLTVAEFSKKHPAAYKTYLALPGGKPNKAVKTGTSKSVRSSVKAAVKKATNPAAHNPVKPKTVTTPHGASTPAKPAKAVAKRTSATVARQPVASTASRAPIRHTPTRKPPAPLAAKVKLNNRY